MSDEKTIEFPLTKKQRGQYENDYEQIFFKKPVHNIKDETLVNLVDSNRDKLTPNEKPISPAETQEGTQNESGKGDIYPGSNGDSDQEGAGNEDGLIFGTEDTNQDTERIHILHQYTQIIGDPDETKTTDELTAELLAFVENEKRENASKDYFDLFGKKPLDEMTLIQIESANKIEYERQAEAKQKSQTQQMNIVNSDDSLKFDPKTQMVVVNRKNNGDKRVINISTYEYLKHDFDKVVMEPKEVKDLKNKI